MNGDPREAAERLSEDAFARSGWADPRADYRALLRRLKEQDGAGFTAAVTRYEDDVVGRLSDDNADAVALWLAFGLVLAGQLAGGRAVRIDADGRVAGNADDVAADAPALVLQLPADERARALVVAQPREPSPAQSATLALLVDGRLAL